MALLAFYCNSGTRIEGNRHLNGCSPGMGNDRESPCRASRYGRSITYSGIGSRILVGCFRARVGDVGGDGDWVESSGGVGSGGFPGRKHGLHLGRGN